MKHLDYLKNKDNVMKQLIETYGNIELRRKEFENPFVTLINSIVSQQLSVKAASTIWQRFIELLNYELQAEKIIVLDNEALRQVGLSYQKISYIKHICESFIKKTIDFSNIDEKSDQEIIDMLVKLKGVGQWTAEMFLMFELARPNVFSFGDKGLMNAINNLYGNNLTQEEVKNIIENYAPYKTYAALYLWKSLNNKPLE